MNSDGLFINSNDTSEIYCIQAACRLTDIPIGSIQRNIEAPILLVRHQDSIPFHIDDVGVVILDELVEHVGYGELPAIGLANELNSAPGAEALLKIVGYGLQSVKPVEIAEKIRYQATPMLVELNGAISGGWNIHLTSNPGIGDGTGGSCFGDSGGPGLAAEDSNIVVGVGSFVFNNNCKGVGYYYRVDTEYAQEFINQFMP